MRASRSVIAEVIAAKLEKSKDPKKVVRSLAAYLLTEGRTNELAPIMRDVMAYRAEKGQVEALVTSAFPLSDSSKKQAVKAARKIFPGAKQLILDERIKKSLVGGIKLNVINRELDLSLRAKLNQLKQLTRQEGV